MIYELVKTLVTDIAKAKGYPSIDEIVLNKGALIQVKEHLREKYKNLLLPANYDWVLEHFTLKRSDYEKFLQDFDSHVSMANFLKGLLIERSLQWVDNRPTVQIFNELIDDIYLAYDNYFSAKDIYFIICKRLQYSKNIEQSIKKIKASRTFIPPHIFTTSDVIAINRDDLIGRDMDIKAVIEYLNNSRKAVLIKGMGA